MGRAPFLTRVACVSQAVWEGRKGRGLFAAGHGNALDELLLEEQVEDDHGDHGQQAACHQNGEVGGELAVQGRKAGGQGHHVQVGVADQRPHQVGVSEHRGEDGQGGHAGAGQGQHDFVEGLPLVAAVQIGGLGDLIGDGQVRLPQEEGAEGRHDAGEDQREDGVGQADFGQHQVLRGNEDLAGQHHLDQDDGEQQVLAGELQLGEGVAGHRAEHHGAQHAENDQQRRVDVQVDEGQAFQRGDKVVKVPLAGQDLGRDRHRLGLGLEAGQDHPHEGKDHDDAAQGQGQVGQPFGDPLGVFHAPGGSIGGSSCSAHVLHLVIDPLLLADELDSGDDADQNNGPDDDGGGIALVAGDEALAVEQAHQGLGVVQGGVGVVDHHVDQVKDFQRAHQAHDQDDEEGGGDHRQGDAEELPHLGRAVQVGGLVQADRDVLQAGQKQDGVVADVAPDLNHRAGDQDDLAVGQPADVGAQQLVDDAVLGVEDPFPDHGDGGGSHDHGQEEDGAVGGAALDLAVQQDGHQQCQEDAHRHRQDAEKDGVPVRFPELGVLEHLHIVGDALELKLAEGQRLGKAHVNGVDERIDVQHDQADDGGGHHDKAPEGAVAAQFGRFFHGVPPYS